jgi:hypothetical protein
MLTAERLRELFSYDPSTGILANRVNRGRGRAGDAVGNISDKGYLVAGVDGRVYPVHRLVWLLVHGTHPKHQIDHINGVRTDNSLANLREATAEENQQNRLSDRGSTSLYVGVSWSRTRRKWRAQICFRGKRTRIGDFDCELAARDAYLAAKSELHGYQPSPRSSKT